MTTFMNFFDNDECYTPIDIGMWLSYNAKYDPEQIELQRNSLSSTGIYNGLGEITFIYSDYISKICQYLREVSERIPLVDTRVILENEVYYTSKIEGAKTSLVRTAAIHNGAQIDKNNAYSEIMVKNGFDAVKLLSVYGGKVDKNILVNVWNVLVRGCCGNEEIRGKEFRTGTIYVGEHEGADYRKVPDLMDSLLEFYNSSRMEREPFLKASIIHYAFETIHPFCDGNGRMGRLLVNNYLISRGVEAARAVSFSRTIDRNRSGYDLAFIEAENIENDCTPFLNYFLDVMATSFDDVLK